MAHFTFTKPRLAKRCRTLLHMFNIPLREAARLGTPMARESITRGFPEKANGLTLI